MGLFERLRAAREALFRPQAANISYQDAVNLTSSEKLAKALSGALTESGEAVTSERAMRVAAVYACVRLAAWGLAYPPLITYRVSGGRQEPDLDNPVYTLLHDRPNEWMTSFEFRELMQRDLELRGNAYALISRGTGRRISELLRLHPDRVEPKQDERTLAITYDYTQASGQRRILRRDEVLHVRGMSDDGVEGLSPIAAHRETIGDAIAVQRHGSRFFSNGAKPLGVIEYAGPMGEEAKKEFRKDWESTYAGGHNAHRTLLLPSGLTYKAVSISMEDAQYVEARKLSVTEIARLFGMPPHKIADLEKATFSNIEHQSIEFVQDAIAPRAKRWEQAIMRDLFDNDPSVKVEFNLSALLRGDARSRAEALQIQRRNGVINANEWRALENMNRREDPGGDEYVVESNMRVQDGTAPPDQQIAAE